MKGALVVMAGLSLLLAACTDRPWNNPYPASQDGKNILYLSFSERPKHLDPVRSYSSNEYTFIGQIYEPPLQYNYLKRPYVLEPLTAQAMPRVSRLDDQGRRLPADADPASVVETVYEIRIRPGILYQPHPAFARDEQGRPRYLNLQPEDLEGIQGLEDFAHQGTRELVAADYVYQIKRLAHPRLDSPIYSIMAEYIVGLKEYARTLREAWDSLQAGQPGAPRYLDLTRYDLPGVEVVDRYTYRIRIRGSYPQFMYWLAMPFFAPVAPEVDRFYTQPGMRERNLTLDWYPVGTGAYMLTENNPNRRMTLMRNPNFRGMPYPAAGAPGDQASGILEDAGKTMPFIDQVVFSLEKENIPYWNKFLQGYYDMSGITSDSFDQAVQFANGGEAVLTDAMRERGIQLLTEVQSSSFYMGFNMLDPVVGGNSERARKLRRAISIAVDYGEFVNIFRNGRGEVAQGPIPPGIFGYQSGPEGINPYVFEWVDGRLRRKSLDEARRLLAEAGYPLGRDRETGKPLLIHLDVTARGPDDKAMLDWFRKQFARIDLQLDIRSTDYNRFQDKMRKGNAQLFMWGWNADYPDPENFLFLLYGPNGRVKHGGENAANYDNPEFNRLFEKMRVMPNGPERLAIIRRMVDIVRRDAPWLWGYHPKQFILHHAWYRNVRPNLFAHNTLQYRRILPEPRERARRQWNRPIVWPLVVLGLILVASLVPGIVAYRRRERATLGAHQAGEGQA